MRRRAELDEKQVDKNYHKITYDTLKKQEEQRDTEQRHFMEKYHGAQERETKIKLKQALDSQIEYKKQSKLSLREFDKTLELNLSKENKQSLQKEEQDKLNRLNQK